MNGLTIFVDWQYFLGIMGALIGIAYYANGRFTKLETSVEWLKESMGELKVRAENETTQLFDARSPIRLTRTGQRIVVASGLKSYIHVHKDEFLARCEGHCSGQHELPACAFRLFSELHFEEAFEQHLRRFAFATGMSTELLRRAGAIYFRDIAVSIT